MGILADGTSTKKSKSVVISEDRNEVREFTKELDPFHESILSLSKCNFKDYLDSKEAVLVMFHGEVTSSKIRDFITAFNHGSKMVEKEGHVMARVDCNDERDLCLQEIVYQYPVIKLYQKSNKKGSVRVPINISPHGFKFIVEGDVDPARVEPVKANRAAIRSTSRAIFHPEK